MVPQHELAGFVPRCRVNVVVVFCVVVAAAVFIVVSGIAALPVLGLLTVICIRPTVDEVVSGNIHGQTLS